MNDLYLIFLDKYYNYNNYEINIWSWYLELNFVSEMSSCHQLTKMLNTRNN